MKSKYIIKVGDSSYALAFYPRLKSKYDWPCKYLTTDINQARIFNTIGTAKSMAARIESTLIEVIKQEPNNNYNYWTPICVIEIEQVVSKTIYTKPFILEHLI